MDIPIESNYKEGTIVYIQDKKEAWIRAEVTSLSVTDEKVSITAKGIEEDSEKTFEFNATKKEILELKTKELPPLCNPPALDGIDDLINLSHLHEPAVLDNLRLRYQDNEIYTYSGIVLVALNPFARVDRYSQHELVTYAGRARGELQPHLFAIAEDAYQGMVRDKKNQTIIVSGESGAGKTMSARYIMRYFATAHDDSSDAFGSTAINSGPGGGATAGGSVVDKSRSVEEQIMATNPVLESFGNAKTTRNDNSSRFGKYLEIHFNDKLAISSASIRTYLLERSRLVFQPKTERNYHIFYQLLAIASSGASRFSNLGLNEGWKGFHYTRQGGDECGVIPDVNDATEFERTCEAMSLIGINEKTQSNIFSLLAALLHIGNIKIKGSDRTGANIDEADTALVKAADLLQVDLPTFKKWLTKKQTKTVTDMIISNLNIDQATVVRDSVAKYIYVHLFSWIVHALNESLASSKAGNEESDTESPFIGVLDIYGFEHFETNSFEQFCINYANEKLQRHFNRHVFQLEQEEYQREGLKNWTFVDFQDNQPCIELIEGKPGVFNILDDVCRGQRTDEDFATMLYQNFAPNDNGPKKPKPKQSTDGTKSLSSVIGDKPSDFFEKPRFDNNAFTIRHYAHNVSYKVDGFIEKNKDTVPSELQAMLKDSKSELLNRIFDFASEQEENQKQKTTEAANSAAAKRTGNAIPVRRSGTVANRKPTLGAEFRLSLIELMKKISSTETHYIRCIKPNENKKAWEFDANMVMAQLRACGVLETIRISCAGYPSRLEIPEFINTYSLLAKSRPTTYEGPEDVRNFARQILKDSLLDPEKYQVGNTKVFFRAGMLAHLHKLRTERRNGSAIYIQKMTRMYLARQRFLAQRRMAARIQQAFRTFAAKKALKNLREEKSAITIQTAVRRYLARKKYNVMQKSAKRIAEAMQGFMARKKFLTNRKENAAIKIQSVVRGYLSRKRFQRRIQAIIKVQCYLRTKAAKKLFKTKQQDVKSAAHFKEVTYQLEGKVVELTQRLGTAQQNCRNLENANQQLKDNQAELESELAELRAKSEAQEQSAKTKFSSLQADYDKTKTQHAQIVKERDDLVREIETVKIEAAAAIEKERARADNIEKLLTGLTEQFEAVKEERDILKNKVVLLEQNTAGNILNGQNGQFAMPTAMARKASRRNLKKANDLSAYVYADAASSYSASDAHQQSGNGIAVAGSSGGGVQPGTPTMPVAPSSTNAASLRHRNNRNIDNSLNSPSVVATPGAQFDGHQDSSGDAAYDPTAAAATTTTTTTDQDQEMNPDGSMMVPPAPGMLDGGYKLTEAQVCDLLRYDDGLLDEILYELIDQLQLPPYDPKSVYQPVHILFPAHVMGLCVIKMLQYNLASRIHQLITTLVARIKKYTETFVSDGTTAFWLSNMFELLSIIKTSMSQHQMTGGEYAESEWVMSQIMSYIEAFLSDIYFGWVRKLLKDVSGFVVPALIDHQELNDYKETESFFSKMMGGGANRASDIGLSHLTNFFTEAWRVMKFYYVDENIIKQVLSEILSEVGAIAFNNLMNRRHFCSSYRGMQIQFNVSKIDEWCKTYDIYDHAQNITRLLQAAKILQMNKSTEEDLRIIIEVSDTLNIPQIKRILRNYKPADGEATVPSRVLHHELLRVENGPIMVDNNLLSNQVLYLTARRVPAIDTYVPDYMVIQRLRAIIYSQTVGDVLDEDEAAVGGADSGHGGSSETPQLSSPPPTSPYSSSKSQHHQHNKSLNAAAAAAVLGSGMDTPTLAKEYEYKDNSNDN
ncbi:Myosin type-2 heavy chain 1 [Mycoemilia scoparia]|uniref:Myosin type-2 heavy chain 1 n=1 Tax=Mycoemilia scoparia TaxID=417184 RepID=A0A9W7ZQ37_9FUNG|nr:Myosin type-2 heavy chain 1 [Mycoemilia scoparia]